MMAKGTISMVLKDSGTILKEDCPPWVGSERSVHLAEYIWRYNHRNDNIENQKKLIMKQLEGLYI